MGNLNKTNFKLIVLNNENTYTHRTNTNIIGHTPSITSGITIPYLVFISIFLFGTFLFFFLFFFLFLFLIFFSPFSPQPAQRTELFFREGQCNEFSPKCLDQWAQVVFLLRVSVCAALFPFCLALLSLLL